MDKLVTWFFFATGFAFVAFGLLAILSGQHLIGLVIVAFGGADLFTAFRRRKRVAARVALPAPRVERQPAAPPVPVPDASVLLSIPEPMTVCPDCGFFGIRGSSGDTVYLGGGPVLNPCRCPRCGYRGIPLRIERREDYAAFVRELREAEELRASEAPR